MMMKLIIASPEHRQEIPVNWVELNSPVGNFVILPGHTPMIITLTLNAPVVYCLTNGHQKSFGAPGGIAQISRTEVTLLLPQKP
ncbi:hypothetical protein KJZ61_01215 [Candidatus Dependentiae bacterium]|nr:hypothetical protein [Candidatus Dependentiae bacterium]